MNLQSYIKDIRKDGRRCFTILDHIDVMDETNAEIMINALDLHVQEKKSNYLPLASEISKIGYSRCKKWRIIENSEIESDL